MERCTGAPHSRTFFTNPTVVASSVSPTRTLFRQLLHRVYEFITILECHLHHLTRDPGESNYRFMTRDSVSNKCSHEYRYISACVPTSTELVTTCDIYRFCIPVLVHPTWTPLRDRTYSSLSRPYPFSTATADIHIIQRSVGASWSSCLCRRAREAAAAFR